MKMRLILLFVSACLSCHAANDFARVSLQGVIVQTGQRLQLRSEGIVYDLHFRSAATQDDAGHLLGHTVRADGLLDLTAQPAQRSRLLFWPERISDIEAPVNPANRREAAEIPLNSPQAQPEGQVPERLVERPVRMPNFDPGDVFEGPEHESILPHVEINW